MGALDNAEVRHGANALVAAIDDEPARKAKRFLEALHSPGTTKPELSAPFSDYLDDISAEIDTVVRGSRPDEYAALLGHLRSGAPLTEAPELLWALFFPEALHLSTDPEEQISRLREDRTVTIERPAADPLDRPAQEILFTSNALLTLPLPGSSPSFGDPALQSALKALENEPQRFWYDHPVPLGMEPAGNEVLYGLKGMSLTADVERERGVMSREERLPSWFETLHTVRNTCLSEPYVTARREDEAATPLLAAEEAAELFHDGVPFADLAAAFSSLDHVDRDVLWDALVDRRQNAPTAEDVDALAAALTRLEVAIGNQGIPEEGEAGCPE